MELKSDAVAQFPVTSAPTYVSHSLSLLVGPNDMESGERPRIVEESVGSS
jgi:hypothetical protein